MPSMNKSATCTSLWIVSVEIAGMMRPTVSAPSNFPGASFFSRRLANSKSFYKRKKQIRDKHQTGYFDFDDIIFLQLPGLDNSSANKNRARRWRVN